MGRKGVVYLACGLRVAGRVGDGGVFGFGGGRVFVVENPLGGWRVIC